MVLITNVLDAHQLAMARIAITESQLPICEGDPWQCDTPDATGLYAPDGTDTTLFWAAMERLGS
jgi:hypothetical protein